MIAPLKIPRLLLNIPIAEPDRTATLTMARYWNTMAEQTEAAVNGILQLPEIQTAIDNANAAAAAANLAAGNAQTSADNVTASSALANSYVTGLTLSAVDAGASVTINISAHQRVYATNPPTTVAVNAGVVTGQPYGVDRYIGYDQASRAGGAVVYQAFSSVDQVAQINNRHSVGSVHTPIAAAPPTDGAATSPPGGQFGYPLP